MAGALDKAKGYGEAGLSIGSALLGSVPAGLGGLYELIKTRDPKKAAEAVESMQESMTYIPRTEQGVKSLQGAAGALETLGAPAAYVGEKTLGATGSPLAATAAEVVLDPLNLLGSAVVAKGTKSAVKGLKGAAERATDVDAIKRYIRSAQQASGLPGSQVIKPKGGNWLTGDVERQTERLKQVEIDRDIAEELGIGREAENTAALNNWVDKKLNKYIKNEMGTPEDPVRALAERGVLHFEPQQVFGDAPSTLMRKRAGVGMPTPLFGKSETARRWEALADRAIDPYPAGSYKYGALDENFRATNPWLEKVPDEALVYKAKGLQREMGFDHLIDELRNSVNPESGLPANLRWSPKDLEKVTVPQAVERVAKINEWRAAQKAEADAAKARNPATFVVKEYPEQKMQWVELKMPPRPEDVKITNDGINYVVTRGDEVVGRYASERTANQVADKVGQSSLEEALKYEGETMGHCVGGYCPDVEAGKSRIYSLRDKKGEPHVTIETRPGKPWNERSGIFYEYPELEKSWAAYSREVNTAAREKGVERPRDYIIGYPEWLKTNAPEVFEKHAHIFAPPPDEIIQIKGKGNRAPKEEYLPMVQDFVRGGNWSQVGDLKNTGLYRKGDFIDEFSPDQLDAAGKGEYLTMDEIKKLREGKAWKPIDTGASWDDVQVDLPPPNYAQGGPVSLASITDKIADQLMLTGMDRDQAILQASRMADAKMQDQKMAVGGAVKRAAQAAVKAAEKAAEAKPAQIGNYQALPLNLPRAPNVPTQELRAIAERIARQQLGEHVRQSPTEAANLAGRSVKEAEKLKRMKVDIQPTKKVKTSDVVPEKVGQVRVALPGDISVADQVLMEIEGLPIGSVQEGGAKYGLGKQDLPDPRFWASNEGPAQIVQNKATDLANMYETPDILAQHLAMGHVAMNFAQHFADANLLAIQASNVHPKAAEIFNKIIREGFEKKNPKTGERIKFAFPDFPGIEKYKESYEAMQNNPEMRKWFNERMKTEKDTAPLGLPNGKEIEYAIMEPALRNMEGSLTGLSVGRMKPGASLIPESSHRTYSHDIAGEALGHTKELTPIELAFPDASAYIKATKRPQDFTSTIQKLFPHQVVDEQYINQLGEYYKMLRDIRGYKKGGTVKATKGALAQATR